MSLPKTLFTAALAAGVMACQPKQPPAPPMAQPKPQPPSSQTAAQKLSTDQGDQTQLTRIELTNQRIELKPGTSILFEPSSDRILPESEPVLAEVAAVMKINPEMILRIEGHTDKAGTSEANLELSKRRAAAVRSALISLGVDSKRVTSVGCGSDYPLSDNKTEEGRANNRRVEFVILTGVVNVCRVYKRDRMGQ
jgi:outer membrane protein OmpA-like peptidoglycan-associated protein